MEFQEFAKIPRYRREMALTEKIDGTNGAVVWVPATSDGELMMPGAAIARRRLTDQHGTDLGVYWLAAQSRQRFVTPAHIKPKNDNYSFAQWVSDHADELTTLGPGYHYGEWWGYGIQRGYGVPEKRFSLFNIGRWGEGKQTPPSCCHVVPLLAYCRPEGIAEQLERLRVGGSLAAPGYQRPEGIIVWHSQSKQYYKILLEDDDTPKSLQKSVA